MKESIQAGTRLNRLYELYFTIVTHYPRAVLIVLFCLLVMLAAGLPRFKLDASADSLTLEHDNSLELYRATSKRYDSGDFLVVTYRPHQKLFSESALSVLANLKQDLSSVDGVASINSILDVPLLYSPKQSLTELAKDPRTLMTEGLDFDQAREEFWKSPIYKNLILGPDGQTTALQLSLEVDTKFLALAGERDSLKSQLATQGLNKQEQLRYQSVQDEYRAHRTLAEAQSRLRVEQVRAIVNKYKGSADIFVGGVTMIAADMIAFIQSDLVVFGVAVIGFMVLVLAIIFRSVKFVVIPMLCCLTSVVMMLGYVSWLDWRLTVISSNFVALLLIISLSIIVHLVVRYREYSRLNPAWSQVQLVRETITFMARPCLYTAITTIVAFMSLVVSDIRPVIDFGWMMTIGLVVALILAFLILPSALVLTKKDNPAEKEGDLPKVDANEKPLTAYIAIFVEKSGTYILTAAVLVFFVSLWGISALKVENKFVNYFHESTEIYQGLTVIDQNLGGTISLDILINEQEVAVDEAQSEEDDFFSGGDEFDSGFEEDAFGDDQDDPFSEHSDNVTSYWMTVGGLRQVEWFHDYLESLPEIGKVQSLATLYKVGLDINGSLNDFELALMQKALSQDVKNVLISPYLSPDGKQTRISLRVIDTYPGLKRAELVARIQAHIDGVGVINRDNVQFSGLLVLYNNMLQSLFSSQILTLGVVFISIFVMLAFLFKSLFVAFVAIVPNIIVALSVLGAMGLLGIPLDMMTITVAAITVGIGVDHTIHYIHRFTDELALDGSYTQAMHRSHASIGRAMYYTAVIIIFGFGIMVLSRFIPTIYFGLLTGFAMFASLLGSLFLLPKLLMVFKPVKSV